MSAPPLPRNAEYDLSVLWSTGTDADTSEYDNPSYSNKPGINVNSLGRDAARAYAPPATPACDFTLPNYDGRYSPGGTLGLFVGRGPDVALTANWGTDVTVDDASVLVDDPDVLVDGTAPFPLFSGNIDTADQEIDRATASVSVRALGKSALLNEQTPVIALSENIRTDQAIALVLDAVGWPADERVLDEGDTDLLYFWSNGDTSAAQLINQILGAEGVPSCAYEDSRGYFHFEGRQFRANNTRSSEIQWNLFDGTVGAYNATVDDPSVFVDDPNVFVDGPLDSLLFHIVPATWSANPDEVVRQVRASVNVRTPTSTQKVWEYGGTLTLAANEVRDLEPTDSDPFKSAVTPVAATDYTVSVGSLASVSLLQTSGQTVTLRLTAGASGATVLGVTSNGIQLRAVSLPVTTTVPVTSTVDTDLSAARFRPKDHTINLYPEIAPNQALDLCNNFARRYQRPRDQMTVQMVNINADHMYALLHMQISDRVHVRHQRAAINSDFYIESMSFGLTDGGGLLRGTLNLERVTDDVPARYGTARYGFDSYTE